MPLNKKDVEKFLLNGLFLTVFLFCSTFFSKPSFAIVGDEEISPGRLLEIRHQHDALMETEKRRSDEEKAYQIELLEEKKQKLESGSPEEKELLDEISKLKSGVVVQKKRWKDKIRFMPTERVVFDSNIRNSRVAKSDLIFNTGTGIQMNLGTQRTKIDVDYDGAYANYLHNHKLSRFEQRLGTSLQYPVSSKTDIEASYHVSSTGDQNSEIRGILERLRQDASLTFNQRLSQKTGIRIGQTYNDVFFYKKSSRNNSGSQYVFSPELNYLISQKTTAFARYALGLAGGGVDDSNKSVANEFRGGIRGKILPKTTGTIDLGYSNQRLTTLGGSVTAFVAEAVVISDITRKSKLEFLMNRSFSQAVQTEGSNFYVTENYRVTASTQFRRFLAGSLNAGVRRNSFDQGGKITGSSQRDLILELGAALRYDFRKWLGFELSYLFSGANSNNKDREYSKQVISLAVNGRY